MRKYRCDGALEVQTSDILEGPGDCLNGVVAMHSSHQMKCGRLPDSHGVCTLDEQRDSPAIMEACLHWTACW